MPVRQDMEYWVLVVDSNARANKIFSVKKKIIAKHIGKADNKTHLPSLNNL